MPRRRNRRLVGPPLSGIVRLASTLLRLTDPGGLTGLGMTAGWCALGCAYVVWAATAWEGLLAAGKQTALAVGCYSPCRSVRRRATGDTSVQQRQQPGRTGRTDTARCAWTLANPHMQLGVGDLAVCTKDATPYIRRCLCQVGPVVGRVWVVWFRHALLRTRPAPACCVPLASVVFGHPSMVAPTDHMGPQWEAAALGAVPATGSGSKQAPTRP